MPFEAERELTLALSLLTVVDMMQIGWYKLPPLYSSGVRYEREEAKTCWAPVAGGCEDWLSAWEVLRQGKGDCEDLAAWRAAELILQGEQARAIPKRTKRGWHIIVRRESGTLEDPSAALGMLRARGNA